MEVVGAMKTLLINISLVVVINPTEVGRTTKEPYK